MDKLTALVAASLVLTVIAPAYGQPEEISEDERAVYQALYPLEHYEVLRKTLLETGFSEAGFRRQARTVLTSLVGSHRAEVPMIGRHYPTVTKYMAEDYERANRKTSCLMPNDLPAELEKLGVEIEILGVENCISGRTPVVEPVTGVNGSSYKPPHNSLSRIGFSPNKDRAVLRETYVCTGWCDWESTIVLKKVNGKWKVDAKYLDSIS